MINITPVMGLYVTVGLNIGTYRSISALITRDLTSKAITPTKEKGRGEVRHSKHENTCTGTCHWEDEGGHLRKQCKQP